MSVYSHYHRKCLRGKNAIICRFGSSLNYGDLDLGLLALSHRMLIVELNELINYSMHTAELGR